MSLWLGLVVVLTVGVGTYIMRAGPILALADSRMPPIVERLLRQVPAAVLSAMVVTLAADPSAGGLELDKVAALLAAAIAARVKKNLIFILAVGMAVLFAVAAVTE